MDYLILQEALQGRVIPVDKEPTKQGMPQCRVKLSHHLLTRIGSQAMHLRYQSGNITIRLLAE